MSIYVEIRIRTEMERLWCATQDPAEHQEWDLRFTRIEYLPRPDPRQPQRFLYATRIGFGREIRGEGESTGERESGGARSSALRFWSDDPLSLIRAGSGYWKYVPTDDGIRFLTLYDYEVRFGAAGRALDAAVFRPLLGWATAWSFDRLRLHLERGIAPAHSARMSAVHAVSRLALALLWMYQGLVPKILERHPAELALLEAAGASAAAAPRLAFAAGIAEIAFGLALLATFPRRWPLVLTAVAMAGALVWLAIFAPAALGGPFNAVGLNAGMLALSSVAYLSSPPGALPLARRCLRRKP